MNSLMPTGNNGSLNANNRLPHIAGLRLAVQAMIMAVATWRNSMATDDRLLNEYERKTEAPHDVLDRMTRIPRPAQARLLLHGLEADSPFMTALNETLPDEAARLAYLNHLAWQARS